MHQLFKLKKYRNWAELETEIEIISDNNEKGDVFEEFVFFFFEYFHYVYQISKHYCPQAQNKPFPDELLKALKLEKVDHGVDGVFVTCDEKTTAYQAKFRSKRGSPTYSELSTFWTEAENADFRLIISNAQTLPEISEKKRGHLTVLVDHFDQLDDRFFETLHRFANNPEKKPDHTKKIPRPYQAKILSSLTDHFSKNDKGKLVAACGIGKTLIALWGCEVLNTKTRLFLAPSLQLIRQTLQEWALEAKVPFRYLCICSDTTIDVDDDRNNIAISDLDVPVTTDPALIKKFLMATDETDTVVFCTYQSAIVLGAAIFQQESFKFDIAVYDEAHRTTGVGKYNFYSQAVKDELIPASKKLFMTATERLVRPQLAEEGVNAGLEVFSMNDVATYGEIFSRLTFGDAIEQKIVSDYRIVFAGMTSKDVEKIISTNRYVVPEGENPEEAKATAAQELYKRALLFRSINELGINKVISFHSRVKDASLFASAIQAEQKFYGISRVSAFHVNGTMPAAVRSTHIKDFENSEVSLLTNAQCLSEGIDIPIIDAVLFADPRGSLINIVQAVGRALRQPYGAEGKIAYILIPILFDPEEKDMLAGRGFQALFNLIQALRDHDKELAEWIDGINQAAVRGKIKTTKTEIGKIKIIIPDELDYEDFASSLMIKIAEVNKNPTGTTGIGSKLGKTERKGSFTRIFKTLCDYTLDVLENNLVNPTFEKIHPAVKIYQKDALEVEKDGKINHNNISHCVRLGLLRKAEKRSYELTGLGHLYKVGGIDFGTLIKNQLLTYAQATDNGLFYPYRLSLEFLLKVREISFIPFAYSLFSIQFNDNGTPDIETAVSVAQAIIQEYPSIAITSETNKAEILTELNEHHPTGFNYNDIWTDRTTTGNQFRYLGRHLQVYDDIIEFDFKTLKIKSDSDQKILDLLDKSKDAVDRKSYEEKIWIV